MKVNIYVLIDPRNLKVKYIGRTSCSLKKRLREHICKSNKNYCKTRKGTWIRKLLKQNLKPIIRNLTIVEGWSESYIVERNLIYKYRDRLLNHDDRGEGGFNKIVSKEKRISISNTLKEYYKNGNLKFSKTVYVYDYNGNFINEFESVKKATINLNLSYSSLMKYFNCKTRIKKHYKKLQFSYIKLENMDNLEN